MDYKSLFTASQHEKGAEVQLIDMEGKLLDMWITIKGADSKAWRYEKHAMERTSQLNAYLDKADQIKIDPDEAVCNALAMCVIGWRGFEDGKGKKVKFTKEKVEQLFLEAPYLRDHIDQFFSERANFTKGKAKK